MGCNSWDRIRLGDCIDLLTGFPFKSALYVDAQDGVRLLRGDNVVQGRLRWDDVKRWPRTNLQALDPYLLDIGDIVLAMDRPWIEAGLKVSRIIDEDLPCLLVQRVARLRARPNLDQRFLGYVIGSSEFTAHVLAIQTGTAVPHISPSQIREFIFRLPPLSEQRAIAAILGSLDDKIELNRRMNRTLEAMAQALFQSWFVDFDPVRAKMAGRQPAGMDAETAGLFPEALDAHNPTEPFPQGWRQSSIGAIATLSRAGLNPRLHPGKVFDHYSIPAYDEGRLPIAEVSEQIKSNKFIVLPNSVLLSKLNPRIPRVWLPTITGPLPAVCSTEFLVLTPRAGITREYLYGLLQSPRFAEEFASRVTGTSGSHQRVQSEHLLRMEVTVPPPSLVIRFSGMVTPMLQCVATNLVEAASLRSIRDTLLPRLLSGELRVPEAETLVEAIL